jgi:hypothetical protein
MEKPGVCEKMELGLLFVTCSLLAGAAGSTFYRWGTAADRTKATQNMVDACSSHLYRARDEARIAKCEALNACGASLPKECFSAADAWADAVPE